MLKLDLSYKKKEKKRNQISKLQKNVKSKIAHLCLKNILLFKNPKKKPKTYSKSKKTKKNISFLKSISIFKISYNQFSFDVTFTS